MTTDCPECYHVVNYQEERKWPDICGVCGIKMSKYKDSLSIEGTERVMKVRDKQKKSYNELNCE